ncbi:hypothetical protein GC170_17685 [bacterium]|nr:hypothetical protein [bacterium]
MHSSIENRVTPGDGPLVGRFEWRAARATIPMAAGLSVAAFRASVMPRSWALLMSALMLDNLACGLIGLDRQKVARSWVVSASHILPERFQDLFDKAWVGPLGLVAPFLDMISSRSVFEACQAIPELLLTLAIWGVFGGAICRIAMARMTRQPIPGYLQSLGYALRHGHAHWFAVAKMGALGLILSFILAMLGAVTRIPVAGEWLAWVVIPVMIVPAAMLVLAIAGVFLGWPLLLGAAMVEESDSFDALTRSQCYLFQAPVTWALTIKIGILIHTAGYYVVRWFLRALVAVLRHSAVDFGLMEKGMSATGRNFPDPWTMPEVSSGAFAFWESAIKLAAVTWPTGFVFAFSAALYLALKARVDLVAPQDVRIE